MAHQAPLEEVEVCQPFRQRLGEYVLTLAYSVQAGETSLAQFIYVGL